MLECVVNVSEGRDLDIVGRIARAAGRGLLDVHSDADHNRSVLTLAGTAVEDAARAVAAETVRLLDLGTHTGAHPRIGALDVVPFVPLDGSSMAGALAARDRFARWAATELALPCFLYGPERSLPEVRRGAFTTLAPDHGPGAPHPTAGACAVGARPVLVAYNLWLAAGDTAAAAGVARALRGPAVRALAVAVGAHGQVSLNLLDPLTYGPGQAYDDVASRAAVARAEVVGLVPAAVLAAVPSSRWPQLDLDPSRTIEARLAATRS